MRAAAFSSVVVVVFVAAAVVGAVLLEEGYGLPGRFSAAYRLDELGLLVGLSRSVGRPVVYEWPIVTLLRPGDTRVNVSVVGLQGRCPGGRPPVTVRLLVGGAVYESNSTGLSVAVHRDSLFLVLKVVIVVDGRCVPALPAEPLVVVDVEAVG